MSKDREMERGVRAARVLTYNKTELLGSHGAPCQYISHTERTDRPDHLQEDKSL